MKRRKLNEKSTNLIRLRLRIVRFDVYFDVDIYRGDDVMSNKLIQKQIEATVCDYCDLEIDMADEDYCYAHIRANGMDVRQPSRSEIIRHYIFSWLRKPNSVESWVKANARGKWVRYDFHAKCLDAAIQKIIADKEKV